MIRWLVAALAAVSLTAGSAAAQQIRSPYRFVEEKQSVGGYVGIFSSEEGSLGLGPEGGTVFGARYSIQIGGAFEIEADLGLIPTSREVFTVDTIIDDDDPDTPPARTSVGEADLTLLNLMGALRLNITGPRTWYGIQPFVLFGGGLAVDLSGKSDLDESIPPTAVFDFGTSFAGQFGAGLEWYVQRNFALRVDVRDVLWKIETPEAFLGPRIPADEWVQNPTVSVGAAYHF